MPIVRIPTNDQRNVRALIDTGSTASFVTVGSLKLFDHTISRDEITLNLNTMQGQKAMVCNKAQVNLPAKDTKPVVIECYVVPEIPAVKFSPFKPSRPIAEYLQGFDLNDPFPQSGGGSTCYWG